MTAVRTAGVGMRMGADVALAFTAEAGAMSAAVAQLAELADGQEQEFLQNLLSGAAPRAEKIAILEDELQRREAELKEAALGAVYFWMFGGAADLPEEADRKVADRLLKRRPMADFIFTQYAIPQQFRYDDLTLHRAGTTSFILKSEVNKRVIKILRWKARANPAMTMQTQRYKQEYRDSEYSPAIERSDRYYIVMEYVRGPTLREYASTVPRDDTAARLEILIRISKLLCEALHYYAKEVRTPHLDLSPENVIVQGEGESLRIQLIDFGYNSSLQEGVTSAKRVVDAQRYIDPELLQDPDLLRKIRVEDSQSDVFSLGIMLLDLLTGTRIGVSAALDQAWDKHPHFALLIEDMIDECAENRLLLLGETRHGPEKYPALQGKLEQEANIQKKILERREQNGPVDKALLFVRPGLDIVIEVLTRLRELRTTFSTEAKSAKRLLTFAAIVTTLDSFTFVAFVAMLAADSGIGGIAELLRPADAWNTVKAHRETLFANLPGRLVALSFSIVGVRYYLRIFATVSVRDLSPLTDWSLRALSFLLWVPILLAMLYEPQWWPFCSGMGVLVVAFANYMSFRLARRGSEESKSFHLPPTETIKNFKDDFGGWWFAMMCYGLFLNAVGLLLYFDIAKDEWIYAALTVGCNMLILISNCTARAPLVRAGCQRLYGRFRRWNSKVELLKRPTAPV